MKFRIILLFVFAFNLILAQNYLYNGDFELGGYGLGFNFNGAGYGFISPPYPGNTQPGDVAVAANPSLVSINLLSVSDHSGNGNMLIVDGGTIGGNQVFWQAGNNGGGVCGLTPGNPYLFSYWARSISAAVSGVSNQSDLIPVFNNANGIIPLNNSSLVPLPAAGWQNYAYEFTATNSCVNIALYDNNLSLIGNDFAIDDLSLMPLSSPLQIVASSTKPNCSDTSSGAIFAYPKGGYPPYTFQIIGPSGTLTNSSGVFTGLLAGNYSISLTDANNQTVSLNNQIVYPNDYLILTPQDTLVCPNSNVLISVSGGTNTNYSWVASPPDPSLLNSINDSILVSPNQSTTYMVSTNVLNENLIWNGNFEIQNNGFYSDLNYLNPNNPNGFQGTFGVTSNASFWEPTLAFCVDHTLGNGIGNMMVVDGSTQGNVIVWKQLVHVESNKTYTFSYYTQSVDGNSPAILKVSLNGNTLGIDSLNNTTCSWQLHTYTWVSGNDSIAQLHIENLKIGRAHV